MYIYQIGNIIIMTLYIKTNRAFERKLSFREWESREEIKIDTWRFRAREFLAIVNSELRKENRSDLIVGEISRLFRLGDGPPFDWPRMYRDV